VQLFVRGLPAEQLPAARVIYFPRNRVVIVPAQTWGGDPFIWFRAKDTGSYLVAVVAGDDYAEAVLTIGEPPPPPPPPIPPVVNPYRPAPEWKATVQPVTRIQSLRSSPSHAKRLATVFDQTANRVSAASVGLATHGDLRAALGSSVEALGLKGQHPGLGTAIETVLVAGLGLENVTIDRPKTSALLRTIAWAIFEAGHHTTAEARR